MMAAGNGWSIGTLDMPQQWPQPAGCDSWHRYADAEARSLRQTFPSHEFAWEDRGIGHPALVAKRLRGTGPHTVITRDADEMFMLLGGIEPGDG